MRRELFETRTEARRAIEDGTVRVASTATPKPSTLVTASEPIELTAPPAPYVSRGGLKLAGALDAFGVDVSGTGAVDVGASTGGFTDCLLQRGAARVAAVDVGYGQLHWRIRNDERVTVVERTNIRTAEIDALGGPFDIVVADLSFISLRMVADPLERLGGPQANWIVLVKPQFEVGKERVGRRGIVSDPEDWIEACTSVVGAFAEVGLGCQGLTVSSITGTTGNVEFLGHFTRDSATVGTAAIERIIGERP